MMQKTNNNERVNLYDYHCVFFGDHFLREGFARLGKIHGLGPQQDHAGPCHEWKT